MQYEFASVLSAVRDVTIDHAALQTHRMRPSHVIDVVSSRGLEEGHAHPDFVFPVSGTFPYDFDLDGFGRALHAALKDSVAGYTMQFAQHGRVIYALQWNWAKRPWDGVEVWTPGVRMHIASCSKLITAMAMTRLLDAKHIPYDTPIVDFLPRYWAKGPNVERITFRHLMTQTSGFNTGRSDSDFETMKFRVNMGVAPGTDPKLGGLGLYHYENMNFGLCRILLATINGNIATGAIFQTPLIPDSNDVIWDYTTIHAYEQYVRDHVLAPAGVTSASFVHAPADALAYSFPVQAAGWSSNDLTSMSGGAGWHLTAHDLLRVMGTFRRGGAVVSPAQAQTMLDNGFGIDVTGPTPIGTMYNKGGYWGNAGGQIQQSLAYFLPRDMEMVVFTNSPMKSPEENFRDKVTSLFTDNIRPRVLVEKHL